MPNSDDIVACRVQTPLLEALDRLSECESRLSDVASRIQMNLEPVLNPDSTIKSSVESAPEPPRSEYTARIYRTVEGLDASVERLEQIIERLEV